MPKTYEPITTQVLTSDQSSVIFSSIPQTYTDLVLVCNARINQSASSDIYCAPNGVTTANKSYTFLSGNGTSASSGRVTGDSYMRIGVGTGTSAASGTYGVSIVNIFNYTNTTTNKTFLCRGSDTTNITTLIAGLFPSTNAITSLTIVGNALVNILSGSSFTLYGVKAA